MITSETARTALGPRLELTHRTARRRQESVSAAASSEASVSSIASIVLMGAGSYRWRFGGTVQRQAVTLGDVGYGMRLSAQSEVPNGSRRCRSHQRSARHAAATTPRIKRATAVWPLPGSL